MIPAKVIVARILVQPRALTHAKCNGGLIFWLFQSHQGQASSPNPLLGWDSRKSTLRENEMPNKRCTFNFLTQYQCDCRGALIPVKVIDSSRGASLTCCHVPGEQINIIGTRVITLCPGGGQRGLPERLHCLESHVIYSGPCSI